MGETGTTAGRSLRVGLIGRGIQRSRTPAMHRDEGAAQGLNLRYDLIDVDAEPGSLDTLIARAEGDGFAGLNVTYPFKREALALCSDLSQSAVNAGAVNTIVLRGGTRTGHNTDLTGFADGLRTGLPGADLSAVLLLGAGGAGGAVGHALAGAGAGRVMIHDLDRDGAAALAEAIGPAGEVVEDLARAAAEATGIVNATPMGMASHPGSAIDTGLLEPRHWVADIVYFPLETALLKAARARGCATLTGAGMAVYQAVHAFELFTGLRPDPSRMRATFEAFDG